ncbi:MAG: phage holin family protein [Deferribacteraceae bacterium]|jgi:putative membrane protein|nr:phage holin family protein [Deferribacteraceae bacterium]
MNKYIAIGIAFRILVNIIGLGLAVALFKHAYIDSIIGLVGAAILLAICNFFIKPIITFLSLPFLLLSFGLLYFVINGLIVLFVAWAVNSLYVDGLWTAIGMSIIISIANYVFDSVYRVPTRR